MKVKRKVVEEHYGDRLDALYRVTSTARVQRPAGG